MVTPTKNFAHAALLFSGLGSIVLLFGVLFSQQIREDLVRAATSPFEVQCFRVLHRAVYRSWRVNSHEPIHGNLELEAVIAAKSFLDLHW